MLTLANLPCMLCLSDAILSWQGSAADTSGHRHSFIWFSQWYIGLLSKGNELQPTLLRYERTATLPCSFRLGRQEDSHEYLRCLLDAMHEAALRPVRAALQQRAAASMHGLGPAPAPRVPPELAATTFVSRVFGGRLRSRVSLCACPCVRPQRAVRLERARYRKRNTTYSGP
jgi:hypothetical protein